MSSFTFADQKDASRYTLHAGDDLVSVLDYRDDGRTLALTRAYTNPRFRGRGYAAEVVARAIADIEERGDRRVSPVCWYVADWFDANPGHDALLAPRRAG